MHYAPSIPGATKGEQAENGKENEHDSNSCNFNNNQSNHGHQVQYIMNEGLLFAVRSSNIIHPSNFCYCIRSYHPMD